MKKRMVIMMLAGCMLVGCDSESVSVEEPEVVEVSEEDESDLEVEEISDSERLGVSESELDAILSILRMNTDYSVEDIEMIREDDDILVDFKEYLVLMYDGENIPMNIHSSMIE